MTRYSCRQALSRQSARRPPVVHILDPDLKMLDFNAHPLEPKKHETKNRLAKPGHGMPVRTHDSRPRTPQHSSHSNPPLSKH